MAEKPVNTLAKSERICGKKSIEALLAGGSWGNAGALKYCWRIREAGADLGAETGSGADLARAAGAEAVTFAGAEVVKGPRMMVSVSKRLFKRAVRRNLLKRRIREAYRLQKGILGDAGVDIMFVYNSKETISFEAIFAAVGQILAEVCGKAQSGTKTASSVSEQTISGQSGTKTAGFVPKNQGK